MASQLNRGFWLALGTVAFGLGGSLMISSCSTTTQTAIVPPAIEGAHFVGNENCAECHADITRIFPASTHARFFKDEAKWHGMSGCESCHGPGSKHSQVGGGRGAFIHNPGNDPAACLSCHREIQALFHLPYHHPVMEGQMNCVQCHDPHGREIFKPPGGLGLARVNEQCSQCHREQSRPFIYEHEALREGCTTCHNPHGSINDKLLVQRDVNLCLKCHSQMQFASDQLVIGQVDHSSFLSIGTCWTAGCHNAIHGSNINPRLLY